MKKISILLLATFILAVFAQNNEPRIVCYYANWSGNYKITKFSPNDINPYLCTHLIYAFGTFMNETGLAPFDPSEDITNGGYLKFNDLKRYNKNLKTLLSIGGWNEGSSRFSSIAEDQNKRKIIAQNTISYLREHNFDGLDLDWNYPATRDGSKPEDKENYGKLVEVLKKEFKKEATATNQSRLVLSMAVPSDVTLIDNGYDVPMLSRYLDWINVISFEYHSAYESTVNHHAALYPMRNSKNDNKNINYTINYYLKAGADPQKLVLGIPTYGRSFTLANTLLTSIGSPSEGPGQPGVSTRQSGNLAYFEICQNIMEGTVDKNNNLEDEYGDDSDMWIVDKTLSNFMGPHAFKGNQWVSYDDMDILKKKAEYVARNYLGGIMVWTIDQDDFLGKCHGKKFPLIDTAKSALYKSLGLDLPENTPVKATDRYDAEEIPSSSTYSIPESKNDAEKISKNDSKSPNNFILNLYFYLYG